MATSQGSGSIFNQVGNEATRRDFRSSGPTFSATEPSGFLNTNDGTGKHFEHSPQDRKFGLEIIPLNSITSEACLTHNGVVKIINIPFTVNKQEIVQFVQRYAQTPMLKSHQEGYPVHIIMEKPTGKTMDCFVEFPSRLAAQECVKKFDYSTYPGRSTRLGNRNVIIDLSTQAELMSAIFPRARLVRFDTHTGVPKVLQRHPQDDWSQGFRGYFTVEEMHGVTKFAESPSRSPFVLKAHQRVYECMISTLYKFPWSSAATYTVAARNALFEATYIQLSILAHKVGQTASLADTLPAPVPLTYMDRLIRGRRMIDGNAANFQAHRNREVGLGNPLLLDLLFAALNTPGFSLLQKYSLCQIVGTSANGIVLSLFSHSWPFQTLKPAANIRDEVVSFWLKLFNSGFDVMNAQGTPTKFERYIIFARNSCGFLVGEWTPEGADLLFETATLVETVVMLEYVTSGMDRSAEEERVHCEPWLGQAMADVLSRLSAEQSLEDYAVVDNSRELALVDEEVVSPRSSRDRNADLRSILNGAKKAGDEETSDVSKEQSLHRNSDFRAATTPVFVPASQRHHSFTASWDMRPTPEKLLVDTNMKNANHSTFTGFSDPFFDSTSTNQKSGTRDPSSSHLVASTIVTTEAGISPTNTHMDSVASTAATLPSDKTGIKISAVIKSDKGIHMESRVSQDTKKLLRGLSSDSAGPRCIPISQRSLHSEHRRTKPAASSQDLLEGSSILSVLDKVYTSPLRHRVKTLPNLAIVDPMSYRTATAAIPNPSLFGPIGSIRPSNRPDNLGLLEPRRANEASIYPFTAKNRSLSNPVVHAPRCVLRRPGGQGNSRKLSSAQLWDHVGRPSLDS